MNKKILNISLISALLVSIVVAFFDRAVSAGIILGALFSRIHLQLLTLSIQQMIQSKKTGIQIFGNLLRLILLALPMLLAMLYPQKINVFGVLIGLLLNKICLYIDVFVKRKEV